MRRALTIGGVALLAVVLIAVYLVRAGNEDEDRYRVRAIFQNAFTVTPGIDVKVAGVRVGSVDSVDVTKDKKAAVVLVIDEPGFDDFRQDARCEIRPQSLIGEKFVECSTSEPRRAGTAAPRELTVVPEGEEGEGQRLLPVTQTSRPVDLDLLNNVMRLPVRQRFSILLNEFGAGLAGNGKALNSVIRNAVPALENTDAVLKILADQNKVLADLARDGDKSLAPLARDREAVTGFISGANKTAQATAERRDDLERTFALFPGFLRQLRPTLERLGSFSDQASPTLADLRDVAPQLNSLFREIEPFADASTVSFQTLGEAVDVGRPALTRSLPLIKDTRTLARELKPAAQDLRKLLTSVRSTGGIERLMDLFYYNTAAINGFDTFGHFLRAGLLAGLCSSYQVKLEAASCSARFDLRPEEVAAARSKVPGEVSPVDESKGRTPAMVRTDRLLRGEKLEDVLKDLPYSETEEIALRAFMEWDQARGGKAGSGKGLELPASILPGSDDDEKKQAKQEPVAEDATAAQRPTEQQPDPAATGAAQAAQDPETSGALLDYLLGDE